MAGQGKPPINPQDYLNAWQAGMKSPNAASKYKNKLARLQSQGVSPPQLAATDQATQNFLQGVQESVSSGKRQASLNDPAATQRYFQNAMNQGAQNLAMGASKPSAQQKALATAQKWAPIWSQASSAAAAVQGPKGMGTAMAKIQAAMSVMMAAAGRNG